jgi:tetratricopeptide (TPR) repeat protein
MVTMLGDLERARKLHAQTLEVSERLGLAGFIDWQRGEHSTHCYWQGRWEESLETASEFIRESEAGLNHYMEAACRFSRAAVWLARGETDAAVAEADKGSELARTVKDPQVLNPMLALQGRVRLTTGDRPGAVALAEELVEIWRSGGMLQPLECVEAAMLFRGLDRADELVGLLSGAWTLWQKAAQRFVAGDLVGAAETYAEIGSLPDEAYSRLKAAEDLLAAGNRPEADRQLRLALLVFARLGATAWAAEGRALLATSA